MRGDGVLIEMATRGWAMEASALTELCARLASAAAIPRGEIDKAKATAKGAPYEIREHNAHIAVRGVLMREVPSIFGYLGIPATSYVDLIDSLDAARADSKAAAIILDVNSPGGSVDGVHAVADRLNAIQDKATVAHIDSLGASAAYWIASQAMRVTATRGARIGSIGAYTPVVDSSRAAENAGIKVHLFSSGVHKGAGFPGTPLSQTQADEIQAQVDSLALEFVADVARGRKSDPMAVRQLADGRMHSAPDALSRGLIDRITSDPVLWRK